MSDFYDARETRDPVQREAELLSALAGQVAWRRKVMAEQPVEELESIRHSLQGGLRFGNAAWVEEMAGRLGKRLERRPPGRPRKAET